jgi:hypothetical protein
MQYLNKFQKELVDLLVKQPSNEINLIAILQKYLPKDLHIGKGEFFDATVWYYINQRDYVYSELTELIMDFVNLINELTVFNYLNPIKHDHTATEELKIGEQVFNKDCIWYSLNPVLSYKELKKVFLDYSYFKTENLKRFKKHDYKQPEDYRADRHLKYLRISVYCALATAIISLIVLLIRIC